MQWSEGTLVGDPGPMAVMAWAAPLGEHRLEAVMVSHLQVTPITWYRLLENTALKPLVFPQREQDHAVGLKFE